MIALLLRTVDVLSMFSSACNLNSGAGETGLTLLGEGRDAFLVVAALAQLLVGVPLDLEACAQTRVVRRVQHSLDRLERKRRHGGERGDDVVENAVERRRVVGNAREQAPAMGFRRRDAAAEHHHVHRAGQPGDARHTLTAAAAGDLAESHFRERKDRILGRDPDVARHGQFEAYSHRIPFQHANDRLRAALRRGDVPREMGHPVALDLRERLDVAARREHAVFAADHDDAHVRILAECLDDRGDLTAPAIGHDIQRRPIEPEKADLLLRVDVVVQAIEIAQNRGALFGIVLAHESSLTVTLLPSNASYSPVRNLRRKSLPDAERGMAFTNTYSRGRLKRGSPLRKHKLSSSSGVSSAIAGSTKATTLAPSRSSGIPTTAHPATSLLRARVSSTSSGKMFSPPLMIMSSTRPTT